MANYKKHRNTFIMENVQIWAGPWRNFSGKGDQFNQEGKRYFWIEIPEDMAEDFKNDNWNVKVRPDREDPDVMHYIIKINVNYNSENPPEIYVINRKRKRRTLMDESVVHRLDRAYITYADVSFNPYHRESPTGPTTTGWLQELSIEIEENYLQEKYADYEDDVMDASANVEDDDTPF